MCKHKETCNFILYEILLFFFCLYQISISFNKKIEAKEIKNEIKISIKKETIEEQKKEKNIKRKFLTKPQITSYETEDADVIWYED